MWMADGFFVGMAAYVKTYGNPAERVTYPAESIRLLIKSDSIRSAGQFAFRLIAGFIIQPRLPLLGPISGVWLRLIVSV